MLERSIDPNIFREVLGTAQFQYDLLPEANVYHTELFPALREKKWVY